GGFFEQGRCGRIAGGGRKDRAPDGRRQVGCGAGGRLSRPTLYVAVSASFRAMHRQPFPSWLAGRVRSSIPAAAPLNPVLRGLLPVQSGKERCVTALG